MHRSAKENYISHKGVDGIGTPQSYHYYPFDELARTQNFKECDPNHSPPFIGEYNETKQLLRATSLQADPQCLPFHVNLAK